MKRESSIPPPLMGAAKVLMRHFQKRGYRIYEDQAIDQTYPYKVHLVFKRGYETLAVEMRQKCDIQPPFLRFVQACQANRVPSKVYFAVPELLDEEETGITHAQNQELRRAGIGLMVVGNGTVRMDVGTIACNRRIGLEPGGTLSKHSRRVEEVISDYNLGQCLDAVRDLSEEVEDATTMLCAKAARKGKINITEAEVLAPEFSWEDKINILSADKYRNTPQRRFLDPPLSRDLKSFKDVRNLSDHRKTAKETRKLESQYPDKMLQGIRLLRDLVRLARNA
jgi:hypothetical protein